MSNPELSVPVKLDAALSAGVVERRLSRYLRATRLIRGIPFMRLVELTGIPESDLEGLEAGSIPVSEFRYGWLPKLAEHLQCPLDELYMLLGDEVVLRPVPVKANYVFNQWEGFSSGRGTWGLRERFARHDSEAEKTMALVPVSKGPITAITSFRRMDVDGFEFELFQIHKEENEERKSSSADTE